MSEKPRACDGEQTRSVQIGCFEGEECEACGVAVAWDMTTHPFFGFKSTCGLRQAAPARVQSGEEHTAIGSATEPSSSSTAIEKGRP